MAIFHSSVQVISRGQGKSCMAAAAYRAGEKLYDERQQMNHDYTKKTDIESEIIAPENSPEWVYNREKLWNEVDRVETRCNSRTARELNIALPIELSKEQQKELAREYVKDAFVSKGMVADVCFHYNDSNNPHFHVMLTTRNINKSGFTTKNREWDNKENATIWREQWANYANKVLERAGIQERIDHRSYKEQGIDKVPTIHLGKNSSEMQKQGKPNIRVDINEQIKEINKQKIVVLQEYRELKEKLNQEKAKEASRYSYLKDDEKAAVLKAEKVMGEPQTYESSDRALEKLDSLRSAEVTKYNDLNNKSRNVLNQIENIKRNLNDLERAESILKELPKNVFGQYKDKEMAAHCTNEISRCNKNLIENGYTHKVDITLKEKKVEELNKEKDIIKDKIQRIDIATDTVNKGVKALQNKEIREFYQEYKEKFPQAKYLRYDEMKAIKAVNEKVGRIVSIEELKGSYSKFGSRLDEVNKQIKDINDNSKRLMDAKKALDTIDKYKDIAEMYDKKVIGREKYQQEHQSEKWQYDNAKARLKECGVIDRNDLKHQESSQAIKINVEQPKLQKEAAVIQPSMNFLYHALQAWNNASKEERARQAQQSKVHDLSKYRDRDGLDYDR